jgi:hypothetical protein
VIKLSKKKMMMIKKVERAASGDAFVMEVTNASGAVWTVIGEIRAGRVCFNGLGHDRWALNAWEALDGEAEEPGARIINISVPIAAVKRSERSELFDRALDLVAVGVTEGSLFEQLSPDQRAAIEILGQAKIPHRLKS